MSETHSRRPGFFKRFFRIVFVLFFVWFLLFGIYLMQTMNETSTINYTKPYNHDAIIVLTGGSDRITAGFNLLRLKQAKRLFISGVHKDVNLQQIQQQQRSVPCCVELGHKAINTKGNALETLRWLSRSRANSILLVTSDYHMPRALDVFNRVIPLHVAITPYSVPFIQKHGWKILEQPEWIFMIATEYNKFLFQKVTGLMDIQSLDLPL